MPAFAQGEGSPLDPPEATRQTAPATPTESAATPAESAAPPAEDADEGIEWRPSRALRVRPFASALMRYELRRGYDALGATPPSCSQGDGDCVRFRARLGVDIEVRASEDVRVGLRFAPQVAGHLGQTSGTTLHPTLALYEGVLSLDVGAAFRLEVGRMALSYGDQVVIGGLDWLPQARSFDAARMRVRTSKIDVDAFASITNEGGGDRAGARDGTFYGIYAMLAPTLPEGIELDVYALGRRRPDDERRTDRFHLGTRFVLKGGTFGLRTELGLQLGRHVEGGTTRSLLAGHALAELSAQLDAHRLAVSGRYATGDDPSTERDEGYAQLFPTAHAFLGLTDVMGARSNVIGGAAHYRWKREAWQAGFDFHTFARPRGQSAYAGSEGNILVRWQPVAGLSLRTMYGVFVAPRAAATVHFFEGEIRYGF